MRFCCEMCNKELNDKDFKRDYGKAEGGIYCDECIKKIKEDIKRMKVELKRWSMKEELDERICEK